MGVLLGLAVFRLVVWQSYKVQIQYGIAINLLLGKHRKAIPRKFLLGNQIQDNRKF